jgi:hypothetical protein
MLLASIKIVTNPKDFKRVHCFFSVFLLQRCVIVVGYFFIRHTSSKFCYYLVSRVITEALQIEIIFHFSKCEANYEGCNYIDRFLKLLRNP